MILIKDILTMPSMKESHLLAGLEGIYKEAGNISVMETPDFESWVQPKTILLTSLYATQDFSYNAQLDLMRRLARTDISAFIIKTEAYVKKSPPKVLLRAGNNVGFL
ncbi:PucR family transcriptional regulator ligand-binding domain-containing protein [Virgibacillus halophilus]|uniref:PucR family transcriptional regulator ligand-binding domain-containing protein n=1 Tax=Tigheibacillus halophilus TaxID=361280 RepID=A0ABU5C5J0_9BACI|nr:PucR family transcriptional regulator ligand-binding domain-containing protein [Virgibacillus halophilus]